MPVLADVLEPAAHDRLGGRRVRVYDARDAAEADALLDGERELGDDLAGARRKHGGRDNRVGAPQRARRGKEGMNHISRRCTAKSNCRHQETKTP